MSLDPLLQPAHVMEGNSLTCVCLSVCPQWVPWPLAPDPFLASGPQVLSRGHPQACHWSCLKSCSRSCWVVGYPQSCYWSRPSLFPGTAMIGQGNTSAARTAVPLPDRSEWWYATGVRLLQSYRTFLSTFVFVMEIMVKANPFAYPCNSQNAKSTTNHTDRSKDNLHSTFRTDLTWHGTS